MADISISIGVEGVEAAQFRADVLCKRVLEHRKQCEAALRQRERYRRKPSGYPADQVAAGVLQDEGLDPLTSGFLIRALARTDSADLAIAVADFLLETRPEVGGSVQVLDAALAAAAVTVFRPKVALRFYGLRTSYGHPASLHAANLAITAASHSGDMASILQILEGMSADGLKPNDYSIIMALQGANYKRRGCTREAATAVRYLAPGRPLSSEVVEALLDVFEAGIARSASEADVEAVFQDLRSLGLGDSTRAYNAVLAWCARRGKWQTARTYFASMTQEDVPADTITFRWLITACLKGGALDAALDIYEWMVAGKDVMEPMPADIVTYNTLIKACHQAGLLEKALEIAAWVSSTGVTYNQETYEELIATVEVAQLWDTKAAKGLPSGGFLQGITKQPPLGSPTSTGVSPRVQLQRGMIPFTLFPEQLRPAPFDGLRFMYLDHLEELQEEATLAAVKLGANSWAASTLMRGGHGQTGKRSSPEPTTAAGAVAGQGIFTVTSKGAASRQSVVPPGRMPRVLAPLTPVALSRAPSFTNISLDNLHAIKLPQSPRDTLMMGGGGGGLGMMPSSPGPSFISPGPLGGLHIDRETSRLSHTGHHHSGPSFASMAPPSLLVSQPSHSSVTGPPSPSKPRAGSVIAGEGGAGFLGQPRDSVVTTISLHPEPHQGIDGSGAGSPQQQLMGPRGSELLAAAG